MTRAELNKLCKEAGVDLRRFRTDGRLQAWAKREDESLALVFGAEPRTAVTEGER